MTQGPHVAPFAEPRARRRVALAVVGIGALDEALVARVLLLDTVPVQSSQEPARVGLGLPLNWVTQNQGIGQPLPWRTGFMFPWETPRTIARLPILVDLLIVGLVLGRGRSSRA